MRHRLFLLTIGIGVLFASSTALALVEGSHGFLFPENDNRLVALQAKGGNPETAGPVKIEFFGQPSKSRRPRARPCLLIPGVTILLAPGGKWFPHEFPEIPVDIVIETHAHFDHDAVHRPHALMVMERLVGEFRLADVEITGLADKHQCHSEGQQKWDEITKEFGFSACPPNNPLAFDNTIQIIKTGGLRIGVWGDNRPSPDAHLDKALTGLDVLVLPVDGTEHILTYKEVDAIIAKYRPRAVVPSHYLVKGAESVLSGLKSADEWVAKQHDVRHVTAGEVELSAADLRDAVGRVYYFGDGFRSK